MPVLNSSQFEFVLLCASAATAGAAVIFLALEYLAGRSPFTLRAPGIVAMLLAVGALFTWALGNIPLVSAACLFAAVLLLCVWPIRSEFVRQELSRRLTPKVLWGVVVLVSLVAARYLAADLRQQWQRESATYAVDLQDVPVRDCEGVTDRGRPLSLFHFAVYSTAAEIEQFSKSTEDQQREVIRLADADPTSNCYGWIFTGGKFGVRDSEVQMILEDNAYEVVEKPREGDLAIYSRGNQIAHAGIVRQPDPNGPILVESKWGALGLYLHIPQKHPFSGECRFYRSSRPGHSITVRPAQTSAAVN